MTCGKWEMKGRMKKEGFSHESQQARTVTDKTDGQREKRKGKEMKGLVRAKR